MTKMPMSAPRTFFRLSGLAVLGLSFAISSAQQPDQGPDPALANMAPGNTADQQQVPAGQPGDSQQQAYPQQQAPAPIVRSAPNPNAVSPDQQGAPPDSYNQAPPPDGSQPGDPDAQAAGQQALDDDIYADQAPPPLPDYDQPAAPGDDYLWTPGYWGYGGGAGYYWVPGVWIVPPYYGALWTPGYWGWWGGRYRWHPGYWGTHVGYYGGVNYGFGYIGVGYFGGYWRGNAFVYNTAVTHVGPDVRSVYNRPVVYGGHTFGPRADVHVSYNGGRGGLTVQPRPGEVAAMHESHTGALPGQVSLHQNAATNPQASFNANHGQVAPAVAAQSRPLGANRPIAASPSAFQEQRTVQQPNGQSQQRTSGQPQGQSNRGAGQMQPQRQSQQPHPQSRPAPAQHSEPHDNSHK